MRLLIFVDTTDVTLEGFAPLTNDELTEGVEDDDR
jgi:hypothetical protein